MVVAELEAWCSRAVAPTRRVALGGLLLPPSAPGEAAAMLLGGLSACHGRVLSVDDAAEMRGLLRDVELGRRTPQPRLRHRFQHDRIGLQRCTHRLVLDRGGRFHLDLDRTAGSPEQHMLAAVYAARSLTGSVRADAIAGIRLGLGWQGDLGPSLLEFLRSGGSSGCTGPSVAHSDPVAWAIGILDLSELEGRPSHPQVRAAFRHRLRSVHPDHGGCDDDAALLIAEIDAARRILLG